MFPERSGLYDLLGEHVVELGAEELSLHRVRLGADANLVAQVGRGRGDF